MQIARPLARLIEAFERLPGIGPKSAQRLTYYLLHVPQDHLDQFAEALGNLKKHTVLCSICLNVSENDPCPICSDPSREKGVICVVEQPLDLFAVERSGVFKGVYHVLHGSISPLNNIGPDEIHIAELIVRLKIPLLRPSEAQDFEGQANPNSQIPISEVILALNSNMEGEATAMYISGQISNLKSPSDIVQGKQILNLPRVTRLARGLPVGADIEYADDVTLSRAMEGRMEY